LSSWILAEIHPLDISQLFMRTLDNLEERTLATDES